MLRNPIDQTEINILYLREVATPLPDEQIGLLIEEELDATYSIHQLPLCYNENLSDSYHRLAYNYDTLTPEHQLRYQNFYRHMKKNANGTYYEDVKIYQIKRKKSESE